MGLGMIQAEAKFTIKAENKEKALIALKKTIHLKSKMTGGIPTNKKFSFVDMEYITVTTLEEALDCWRWEAKNDSNGNIISIEFIGEKVGDCKVMFNKISPFVENGSYIDMWVEDKWRRHLDVLQWWIFENGKLKTKKIILKPYIHSNEYNEFIKQNPNFKSNTPIIQNIEVYKNIKKGILEKRY